MKINFENKIDILKDMDERYGLVNLYKHNIVNPKVISHKDIFEKYDTFIKMGWKKARAIDDTANYFNMEIQSTYRIIAEFK